MTWPIIRNVIFESELVLSNGTREVWESNFGDEKLRYSVRAPRSTIAIPAR